MGAQIAVIVGWAMGLIFVYLLLTHGDNTVNIVNAASGSSANIIKALQGR